MKQCPTCSKEFPDSMRFCQTDGTLLVEKVKEVDPYKTVVGNQDDIASAIPPLDPFKTMVASPPPKKDDDDILDIPGEPDMLKTMVVPQDELKAELKQEKKEDFGQYAPSAPLIEPKPPISVKPPVEPIADNPFSTPPNFGDIASPKSENAVSSEPTVEKKDILPTPPPFESKPFENDFSNKSPYGNQDSKPIPSPFDLSMPPGYMPPTMSPFEEPKQSTPMSPFEEPKASTPPLQNFDEPKPASSPFDAPNPFGNADPFNQNQPLQQSEWTPPPAPDANWQNQPIGSNSPLQPPVPGQSLNQTLPIVSLILGIISLCCYTGWITGPAALIVGYLGIKNINKDPNQYGGKGLAIAGMVIGGIFTVIWLLYWIFIILVYAGLLAGAAFSG